MPGSARDCLPRAKFWNLRDSRHVEHGGSDSSYLDPPCHGCEGDWPENGAGSRTPREPTQLSCEIVKALVK